MNERIKELATKAVGMRSCYMVESEYVEFAELIVKECARMAGEQEFGEGWDGPIEDKIKKHFGVEE